MGYVFDALNRADNDQPNPKGQGQAGPAHTGPGGDEGQANQTSPATSETTGRAPTDAPKAINADRDRPIPFTTPITTATALQDPTPSTATPTEPMPMPQINSQWIQNLDDRLVVLTDPSSQLSEEYRAIRTSMLARWEHRRNLVHTITSATPQEGKTITSLNLGLAFAELRNRKTIVVEADLRLPTFNKLLHIGESKGLVGYLRGEADLDEIIKTPQGNALHLLTAGNRAGNDAVQLLSNQRMINLLEVLRSRYDHVIIDTPPVIELADAGILGGLSDEVMLIARISRTPRPLIEQALRALCSYNAPVAGVIATDQQRSKNRYHYYRYGYRYRYQYYAKRAA